MEKIEEKQQEKKKEYVALYCTDYAELSIKGKTYLENELHNDTDSILFKCNKAMLQYLISQGQKGIKVDFMLMCGKIGFLVEKEAAEKILEFQKVCIEKIKHAPLYESSKVSSQVNREFIKFIRDNYSKSFSNYALVEFYDTCDYTGSVYGECNANYNRLPEGKVYAKGMIDVRDYSKKLGFLNYVEGVNPTDTSVRHQITFLKDSINDGSTSYFGYAVPLTLRAHRGKNKKKGK
ncbi:MAG: hypothetical protein IKP98_03325 [Bacilli bacterium]|nr:hypothetical protein [Bacilli bacterium]